LEHLKQNRPTRALTENRLTKEAAMSDNHTESACTGITRNGFGRFLRTAAVMLVAMVPTAHAQDSTDSGGIGRPSLTTGVTEDAQLIRQMNDIFIVANHRCEQGNSAQCATLADVIKSGFLVFLHSRDCIEGLRSGCENYALFRSQMNDFYAVYTAAYGTPDHDANMLDMPLGERETEWASKLGTIFAPEPRPLSPCAAITPECGHFDMVAMRENQIYFLDLIGMPASEE